MARPALTGGAVTNMTRDEVFAKLQSVNDLPTLPPIIGRLRQVLESPDSDAQQVVAIIQDDPAMVMRILKVANSALFGFKQKIHSVQHAVTIMGFAAVSNLATSTAVFSAFGDSKSKVFDHEQFWRHSVSVGIGMNVIYARVRANLHYFHTPDILHLAGLLHDMGKIVLEQYMHEPFRAALQRAQDKHLPLFQAEQDIFGTDHAEVGAWLAEKWNLDLAVHDAIAFHHKPEQTQPELLELLRLCHSANHICNLKQCGDSGDNHAPAFRLAVWKHLGLRVRDIEAIVATVKEESKHSETLLALL